MKIDLEMMLPDVLRRYPVVPQDLRSLRVVWRRLWPRESVAFFARAHQVDKDRILQELEAAAQCDEISPRAKSNTR